MKEYVDVVKTWVKENKMVAVGVVVGVVALLVLFG